MSQQQPEGGRYYRTEVVLPGEDGELERLLDGWHEEGWRLHTCLAVPMLSGPRTDPRTTVTTGFYVVLERREA